MEDKKVKTLNVSCPCCQTVIVVDALSGEVFSHEKPKKEKESIAEFMERQKNRSQELDAKMAAAMEKQKNRKELLERKFQAAKENKDLKDPPPSIIWD
ncbi:MAG: hypothetical protein GX801_05075 [Fibrobacter sp.]|nr:hypothetical protein [Fibrobacter sp.]